MLSAAKHLGARRETLRFAQGDNTLLILIVKVHYRPTAIPSHIRVNLLKLIIQVEITKACTYFR